MSFLGRNGGLVRGDAAGRCSRSLASGPNTGATEVLTHRRASKLKSEPKSLYAPRLRDARPAGIAEPHTSFVGQLRRIRSWLGAAPPITPQCANLRRLWAVQTSAHSARTFSMPRSRNWRKPRACLYQKLFAPFETKLAAATTVYVAPDGILDLVPFARLKLADGHYWGERQQLRLLQSGRDLLRPDADKPARGLLALGGIDFGAATDEGKPDSVVVAVTGSDRKGALTASPERSMTSGCFRPAVTRRSRSRNGISGCARTSRRTSGWARGPARPG
jgi:hypothetical protein